MQWFCIKILTKPLDLGNIVSLNNTNYRGNHTNRTGNPIKDPVFNTSQEHLRRTKFKHLEPGEMSKLVQNEVFPFISKVQRSVAQIQSGSPIISGKIEIKS